MEPEDTKPDEGIPPESDAKNVAPDTPNPERARAEAGASTTPPEPGSRRIVGAGIDERKLARMSRRELLKVAPVLALGAFAVPGLQEFLLKKGLGFSDWASARLFRRGHLAPTFSDADVTPFDKFPINGYDVDDPGVIFENWALTVRSEERRVGKE